MNESFQITCIRKHTILDAKYVLTLLENFLQLAQVSFSRKQPGKQPKYRFELTLRSCIGWNVNNSNRLESFSIEWNDKIKVFHAAHEDLLQLKLMLRNKIMFKTLIALYKPVSSIGDVDYAEVYLSQDKMSGSLYAIRCLQKYQYGESLLSIYNEIGCLREIDSPNVQKLHESYRSDNAVYLVQEYVSGNNLFDIIHSVKLDTSQTRAIMRQLLVALRDIHAKGVIHYDIKPSNICFKQSDALEELKVVDFGLAVKFREFKSIPNNFRGTPGYIAPEVFKGIVINKSDIFSAGCTFFRMLTNKEFFQGRSSSEVLKLNKAFIMDLSLLQLYKIQQQEVEILKAMLDKNPQTRLSAEALLNFPYFQVQEVVKKVPQIAKSKTHSFRSPPQIFVPKDEFQVDQEQQPTVPQVPNFKSIMNGSLLAKQALNLSKNRFLKKSGTMDLTPQQQWSNNNRKSVCVFASMDGCPIQEEDEL